MSTGLAVWATRSQGLLRLLSVADPWAHQSRTRAVWGLLALVVLLVVGLKTGSPDRDAYKNLVFGEGEPGGVEPGAGAGARQPDGLVDRLRSRMRVCRNAAPVGCSSGARHVLPWC